MVRRTAAPPEAQPTAVLTTMTAAELTAEFNRLTGNDKKKFSTRTEALNAVTNAMGLRRIPAAPATINTGVVEGLPEQGAVARNRRSPKNVRARNAQGVIRILADPNPYRNGTDVHAHFEKMKGGITVLEYLAKFSEAEQRVARQWLYNVEKKNRVKIIGG